MKAIIDQYGKKIPRDLSLLPGSDDAADLSDHDREIILSAPWYEKADDTAILVPDCILKLCNAELLNEPADYGIDVLNNVIVRIADALKRYSRLDGFYHA